MELYSTGIRFSTLLLSLTISPFSLNFNKTMCMRVWGQKMSDVRSAGVTGGCEPPRVGVRCQISWSWSYTWLWAAWHGYWKLNLGFSGRVATALKHWAISSVSLAPSTNVFVLFRFAFLRQESSYVIRWPSTHRNPLALASQLLSLLLACTIILSQV